MRKNFLLPAISGLLLAFSFPVALYTKDITASVPNGILIFIAFIPLLLALDREEENSFLKGLVCGSTFYLLSQFWIIVAMKLYGNLSFFSSLGILILMSLYLALYISLFSYLYVKLKKRFNPFILVPVLLVSVELIKNFIFQGYPWMNPGYALCDFPNLIQIVDITGIYGLTFLVGITNVFLYKTILYFQKKQKFQKYYGLSVLIIFILCIAYGLIRKNEINNLKVESTLNISLVQGNISQDEKWNPGSSNKIFNKYLELSQKSIGFNPDLIVWPEAAIPRTVQLGNESLSFLRKHNLPSKLVTGAITQGRVDGERRIFNSAFYTESDGKIIGRYDKIHLVPFSEHVLYDNYIPLLRKIVPTVAGNFDSGDKALVFTHPKGKFGILICFESIFGTLSKKFVNNGAEFLVNITNDAWFGKTSAPYQHFDMLRFRAIEARVPVVRAANTGISAIIDSTGRVIKKTSLFEDALLNGKIELKPLGTLYMLVGDLLAYICLLLSICALISSRFVKR